MVVRFTRGRRSPYRELAARYASSQHRDGVAAHAEFVLGNKRNEPRVSIGTYWAAQTKQAQWGEGTSTVLSIGMGVDKQGWRYVEVSLADEKGVVRVFEESDIKWHFMEMRKP